MKFRRALSVCLLCLGLASCISLITPKVSTELASLKSGAYELDPAHAAVLFKVNHLGLSTYVGRFNSVQSSLDFDPNDIANMQLQVIVEIESLDINDDSLASDLMGGLWFDAKNHPQAVFRSSAAKRLGETNIELVGELTIKGVTQDLSVLIDFHGGANNILSGKYTLGFSAGFDFSRSDFGIDAFVPLVGDQVTIEAFGEFLKLR
ncbi:MAG: YceI family protein [Pseudomonadota bacterium]